MEDDLRPDATGYLRIMAAFAVLAGVSALAAAVTSFGFAESVIIVLAVSLATAFCLGFERVVTWLLTGRDPGW